MYLFVNTVKDTHVDTCYKCVQMRTHTHLHWQGSHVSKRKLIIAFSPESSSLQRGGVLVTADRGKFEILVNVGPHTTPIYIS